MESGKGSAMFGGVLREQKCKGGNMWFIGEGLTPLAKLSFAELCLFR